MDPALDVSRVVMGGHFCGVYPALVADNQDPDSQGRVLVRLPWSPDAGGATYEVWARLSTMMAGNDRAPGSCQSLMTRCS
jgi:uncharacterized protein involved in type VI secretion and phage assembly